MAQIGSLSVKLGLVTVDWDKATDKAKKQAQDLHKAFEDLGSGVKKLNDYWKMLGGAISVGSIGFAALTQQTIAFTDEITDLSKGFGLTISQTLAFRDALMGAGVSADNASKMIGSLFTKIDDARQGNDKTIAQFEKLGISFGELKTMSPYDAIKRVADGFKDITNEVEKVRLIKDFFGRAGVGIEIEEISRVLGEGTGRFDKYAESIKKVGVINDNIKKSMDNLKIAFADLIAPFTRDSIVSIEKFQAILLSIAAATVVATVGKLAIQIYEVAAAIRAAAAAGAIFNATAGGFSPMGLLLKGAGIIAAGAAYLYSTSQSKQEASQLPARQSRAEFAATDERRLDIAKSVTEETSKEAEAKKALVNLNNQLLSFERQKAALQLEQITNGGYLVKMQIEDVNLQEKIAQINAKRKQDLETNREGTEALKGQINELADIEIKRAQASTIANKRAIEAAAQYRFMIQQIEANPSFHALEAKDYSSLMSAGQQAIEARGNAIAQSREQMRLADLANQRLAYENSLLSLLPRERDLLMQNYDLEAKLTEFAREQTQLGQDDEWIKRRVQQLRELGQVQIELNRQTIEMQRTFQYGWNEAFQNYYDNAMNAANQGRDMFNAITSNMESALTNFVKNGKLSFKDFARSVIQDLLLIQMKAQAVSLLSGGFNILKTFMPTSSMGSAQSLSSYQNMAGATFADGGDPPVGKVSLVGEQGPELFVPKTAGTIIPNKALGSFGGSTTINNFSINAIDTKSFEDRLLNSPNAVWAANQYASKSLAFTKGRA